MMGLKDLQMFSLLLPTLSVLSSHRKGTNCGWNSVWGSVSLVLALDVGSDSLR